jgi:hypothetical protein
MAVLASMDFHPSVGPVSTVWIVISRKGVKAYHHSVADVIWVSKVPHVVIEWDVWPDGDRPGVTVPLDPQYFHELNWPQAKYLYEFPIEDPRNLD